MVGVNDTLVEFQMSSIYVLVHSIFKDGYLSTESEKALRTLMVQDHNESDVEVLMTLRHAVLFGHVKRQTMV